MHSIELYAEGAREMSICNSCRYCEGICAVFPALQNLNSFTEVEQDYLANLCHSCGACYSACQYAPPHEFAINIPQLCSQLRTVTYEKYVWPASFAALFRNNRWASLASVVTFVIGFSAWIILSKSLSELTSKHASIYALISHRMMVLLFGSVALFSLLSLTLSAIRFWRAIMAKGIAPRAFVGAIGAASSLRYLDGGGGGCNSEHGFSSLRRVSHHLVFYGFFACFAATSTATFYHYALHREAPYALSDLPVVLGATGGVAILLGTLGLGYFRLLGGANETTTDENRISITFLALLAFTSATGLILLIVRTGASAGIWLTIHLAVVLGMFVFLPYGKFVHALYRLVSLIKFHGDRSDQR